MAKIYSHFARLTILVLTLCFASVLGADAQIQWKENFDYTAGDLYGQGGWGKYGSDPDFPIQVVDQTLDYEGYPGEVSGKSVKMVGDNKSQDLLVRFDPNDDGVTSGNVYYSALINVSEAPSAAVYSMTLLSRAKSYVVQDGKSPSELGRLFFDKGDSDGQFKLGVERGSGKPVFADASYEVGKTYLVVVKYEINETEKGVDKVSCLSIRRAIPTNPPRQTLPCSPPQEACAATACRDLSCARPAQAPRLRL